MRRQKKNHLEIQVVLLDYWVAVESVGVPYRNAFSSFRVAFQSLGTSTIIRLIVSFK